MRRVLILGAGFGGLELSTVLSDALGDDVEVTLIDKGDSFVFGFAKLDVMFGRTSAEAVRLPYAEIAKPGVLFLRETVTKIDPEARAVTTDAATHEADVLVIALGADYDYDATPGLLEAGNEFYSVAGAERLAGILQSFTGGRVVIGVCGAPFKCPPAPSETALLLHDYLVKRGLRDACQITRAGSPGRHDGRGAEVHGVTQPYGKRGGRPAGVLGARRALALAGSLALASLAVAGCGSSHKATTATIDRTAPAITKSEFVRKANAICAKGNAKNKAAGAKLGAEPSEAQVVAFVKHTEVPAVQAQINALKALGAPAGDEAKVAKMLTLAQAGVNAVKAQPTIVTSGANVFARFARVAHPYGLISCAPTS